MKGTEFLLDSLAKAGKKDDTVYSVYATVITTSPLAVLYDGDSEPADAAPDILNGIALADNARVLVLRQGRYAIIIGGGPGTTTGLPTGAMVPYLANTPPGGFLLAAGQAVSRQTYSDLFDVIGTTYGAGNGVSTFTLPDLRERVPVGMLLGSAEFGALGSKFGTKTHTLTTAQMPVHNHSISRPPWRTSERVTGNQVHSPNGTYNWHTQTTTGDGGIGNAGGGGAHNNVQPSIAVNYLVKT